ncbi:hypothetical protein ACHQM5_015496 [Ranunculus cassubicifolius]
MGSLMAGWSSATPDSKSVLYERNKSFTKEEIEAYWRTRGKGDGEYLRVASLSRSPESTSQDNVGKESGGKLQRSNSLPVTDRRGNFLNIDSETALNKLLKKNDWWTRSNFAFLNEPPVIEAEGPSYKYASQYHVTDFSSSRPTTLHGIST